MPTKQRLEQFIAHVESNDHAGAIAEFYTEDCALRENQAEPRLGRDHAVARERAILERAQSVESTCVRPLFVADDRVVIRWKFRFVWLDGKVTEMEELAYQEWRGDRIANEQFFYDPAQREPKVIRV